MFLSHHKGGAAVLARFIKEFCKDKVLGHIFLDCDELSVLEHLFSIAAEDTKNFVMVLTSQTLQRFWVAGEIASAFRFRTPMIGLACDGFTPPTDEFIASLESVWSDRQKVELSSLGVSVKDIQQAYHHLQNMEYIRFRSGMTFDVQDQALEQLIDRCQGIVRTAGDRLSKTRLLRNFWRWSSSKSALVGFGDADHDIFITGNMQEMEALFTCRLLHWMVQFETQRTVTVVGNGKTFLASGGSAGQYRQYLLCVCTKGIVECEALPGILQACDAGVELIPVVAEPGFDFPDDDFYRDLLSGNIFAPDSSVASSVGLEQISELYKRLFSRISLSFTASGNRKTQKTEVLAMSEHLLVRKRDTQNDLTFDDEEISL
mmetsp:Transcript_32047/g.85840  ORF Transcript_32047/g.85840 Transcript_32047/m.85840 type:complete len:374 (-) Transcript_32047:941-2062(-)|eukprot:CAMPEP_0194534090 /NCGR_PEP_ID=MMETSP0253-20130528/72141_1 /TAXON_ID=2966 /ORGANISM="Noctiluca scintillans" /LENGTH=373 /DNA_ID=CAMNT_0039379705 /DNA_START=42 /DNA_END=1163 /DNA_ORIENTATION=+